MSIYSTLYDALHTRIAAKLPSHTRIHNPYSLEQNNAQFLRQGYGVAIDAATNTERNLSCKLSIAQTFIVSITRQFYAREFDGPAKATTEKDLLEDALLIIKDFELNTTLNSPQSVIKFVDHTGIQNIFFDQDNYIAIRLNFQLELFDDLNT